MSRACRLWFAVGALLIVFWLMVARPALW